MCFAKTDMRYDKKSRKSADYADVSALLGIGVCYGKNTNITANIVNITYLLHLAFRS